MVRTFKNIKTGKKLILDENNYKTLIADLEKDKDYKELIEL